MKTGTFGCPFFCGCRLRSCHRERTYVCSDNRAMDRRQFVVAAASSALAPSGLAAQWPVVVPGTPLRFPRNHRAHPEFRTEWWYLTAWLRDPAGHDLGVQITFFRSRPGLQELSSSRFAPDQLLFAHAAIADASHGRLRHDQRSARAGFDLASASTTTTDVRIGDWRLTLFDNTYRVQIDAGDFSLELKCEEARAIQLQGDRGVSRKGLRQHQASWYYSHPQLRVTGTLHRNGQRRVTLTGTGWLDHEWFSELLDDRATGWDWCGINLHDGGSLMAFRIRDHGGGQAWAGGSRQLASGAAKSLSPHEIRFLPLRFWRSPRTGVGYPVVMDVTAGGERLTLEPMFDDQELDARATTGTLSWEGAVRATVDNREVGRGYLELTGYGQRVRF